MIVDVRLAQPQAYRRRLFVTWREIPRRQRQIGARYRRQAVLVPENVKDW